MENQPDRDTEKRSIDTRGISGKRIWIIGKYWWLIDWDVIAERTIALIDPGSADYSKSFYCLADIWLCGSKKLPKIILILKSSMSFENGISSDCYTS